MTLPSSTSPAPVEEPIAEDFLDTTAENQAATYRHIDRQRLGIRVIPSDPDRTSVLPCRAASLEHLSYSHNGFDRTLGQFIANHRTSGLLVLKDGVIVHEQYAMGNTGTSRWTSMSIAKSVTATLIGAAVADGSIGGIDDPVIRYVPELDDSAYKDNTIRQLLTMSSGIAWAPGERTTRGNGDLARMFRAVYGDRPRAVMEQTRTRPRISAPGDAFHYSTGDSYVLAAVVAGATGAPCCDYLSEKIWRPLGMEADAYWMLDAPGGLELGGAGISATLRDYGRFGQFILAGGEGVLPRGWRDQAGKPETWATSYGNVWPDSPLGYGYQWWAFPPGVAGAGSATPTFAGSGINGQLLYINPDERIVVVMWSAWRQTSEPESFAELSVLLDALVNALH